MTSLVLARGAVEVRAFRVSGAPEGTSVRITGWAAQDGARAELLPVVGLNDDLAGSTTDGTLFVALARLTADPEPVPLADSAAVHLDEAGELTVRWSDGTETRVRLHDGSAHFPDPG